MANSIFKKRNLTGATTNNQTQNSFSQVTNNQTSNGKSWNTSSVSNSTQNALKKAERPYSSLYEKSLNSAIGDINNRKKFEYDLNEDAVYKQYAERYKLLGNQAMQDTMANAATLSGGYGNSYASTAGQQAYNSYLQRLNDIVPELYQQARTNYDNETNNLYNKANLYAGLDSEAYTRYADNRNYYQDKYNNEWNQNMVSHSTQNDTSTQTEHSNSYSSNTQSNYTNQKSSLVLPTYEERVDAAHSHNRALALMDTYGLSGNILEYNTWRRHNEGNYTDYQNYLSRSLNSMINEAYGKKERKSSNNRK